jgi:multidrug efflux system membrane fusion protein
MRKIAMLSVNRWTVAGGGLIVAASAVFLTVALNSPISSATAAIPKPVPPLPVRVVVSTVESKEVRLWEDFSGRLEAVDRVEIRPRVSGAVEAVHFREGALVGAGDLLFTIDPAPYQATLARADGQVSLAQAKVRLAQTELDRGRRLSDNRTISQSDLDQRESAVAEAQASLQSAKAARQSAQLDVDYSQVKAPVAGRVGKIEVTVGNLVAAGSTASALTTVVSVNPIYVRFDASEELVTMALSELPETSGPALPIGKIPVEAGTLNDEGFSLKGQLQLIDNEVNAQSGTISVRAVFPNSRRMLIPGQFVRVRMGEVRPHDRLLVSDKAIATDQDKKYVFVVDAENTVSYRPVVLGGLLDGMRIVTSGLTVGETIVEGGLQRIRAGSVVAPVSKSQQASSDH